MGLGTHVGRVGALAVALGIGSAVAGMPAVAWAKPEGGTSVGASQNSSADAGRGAKTADKPTSSAGSKDDTASSKTADSDDPDTNVGSAEKTKENPKKKRTSGAARRAAAADSRDEKRAPAAEPKASRPSPERSNTLAAEHEKPKKTTAVDAPARRTVVEDAAGSVEQPARVAVRSAEPAKVTAVGEDIVAPKPVLSTVLRNLFSPRATSNSTDAPEGPGASPVLWTMLAYVRRQFDEQRTLAAGTTTATPAAAVSTVAAQNSSVIAGSTTRQSPVISANGTIYQVTTGISSARVTIFDNNAQVLASSRDIDGYLAAPAVARPDGTLIITTSNQRGTRSTVSAIDSTGAVTTIATFTGRADSSLQVDGAGGLYFNTDVPQPFGIFGATIPYRYVRITPTNAVQTFPPDTTAAVDDDGSAYLVSSQYGASTLRVFTASGATKTISLPYGSTPSAPILGQDGNVYVIAGVKGLFGTKTTRVYVLDGTASTMRTVTGLPGATVVTPDGLYLETVSYAGSKDGGTGTTYISRVTGSSAQTSDPITGRIAGFSFQVTPDGTIYAPITNPSLSTGAVAVVAPDGTLTTTVLPGTLVTRTIRTSGGAITGSDDVGYVNYRAGGIDHVAVLNPDGTIARTIDLPANASASTVFFGPDGAAYELLDYYGPDQGQTTARQIIALGTGTTTAVVPGRGPSGSFDVGFSTTGIGYLLAGTPAPDFESTQILGFDSAGNTVIPLSVFAALVDKDTPTGGFQLLTFTPDGTAYVMNYSDDSTAGVYALTSSGPQKVADINRAGGTSSTGPVFTDDGSTGFFTVAANTGGTLVVSFAALSTT